ncbi:MAG: hypothetical protein U0R19_41465 [Bryobacteraceae bacterium]
MKTKQSLDATGRWWKASEYDMVGGTVVMASGASLSEYDPWPQFLENRGKYRVVHQPYVPFLNLHPQLEALGECGIEPTATPPYCADGSTTRGPRNEADDLILSWCEQHGLLGILQTRFSLIRTPTKEHYRRGGRWNTRIPKTEQERKRAVEEEMQQDLESSKTINDLLDVFPDLSRPNAPRIQDYEFPLPNSARFWTEYGESTAEFNYELRALHRSVFNISECLVRRPKSDEELAKFEWSRQHLRSLTMAAGTDYKHSGDLTLDDTIYCPSLLTSFAVMLMEDFRAGRRVHSCEKCATVFVSNEPRAKFCSPRCRNSVQSARHYRKKKSTSEEGVE